MGQEIQSAIQAGKEVTFHERGINAHGFSGHGYIITDPDTGGGAYLIEGKGNGGVLFVFFLAVLLALMSVVFTVLAGVAVTALTLPFAALLFFTACLVDPTSNLVFHTSLLAFGVNIMAFVMFTPALFLVPLLVSAVFLALAVYGLLKPNESRMTCRLIGLG